MRPNNSSKPFDYYKVVWQIFFSLILVLLFSFAVKAQIVVTIDKDGNYIPSKKSTPIKDTTNTGKYLIIKNERLPIYRLKSGKEYVGRVSKKTGNYYRQYLKRE